MPQSGFTIEDMSGDGANPQEEQGLCRVIEENAKRAMELGLFMEWLESFVGAYNEMTYKNPEKKSRLEIANIASQAGIIEWDM